MNGIVLRLDSWEDSPHFGDDTDCPAASDDFWHRADEVDEQPPAGAHPAAVMRRSCRDCGNWVDVDERGHALAASTPLPRTCDHVAWCDAPPDISALYAGVVERVDGRLAATVFAYDWLDQRIALHHPDGLALSAEWAPAGEYDSALEEERHELVAWIPRVGFVSGASSDPLEGVPDDLAALFGALFMRLHDRLGDGAHWRADVRTYVTPTSPLTSNTRPRPVQP